jgi:glycosyltransferase involved in cell wall biosynthesis
LIDAVAALSAKYPDLHVVIAGQGQLHDEPVSLGVALGISPRLHLLGLRSDVANLLAGADVFAMPSLAEGLPLALLEAMLASRAIVASDVGEIGAVLDRGNAGLLVRPGAASEIVVALDQLLSNPSASQAVGARAACRARTEYTLERMAARYEAVYRRLLAGRPVASRA